MISSFYSFLRRLKRFWVYGKNGYNSFDFDSHYLYDDINLRLSRCYNTFLYNGHCVWSSNRNNNLMKKLREAIKLSEFLRSCDHDSEYAINVMKKWNRFDEVAELNNNDLTEKEKRQFSLDFRAAIKKDTMRVNYARKRLFYLLEKYIDNWWD